MSPEAPISVVLTVDVEPDNAWENHLNPSVANVKELLRLQELLDKYGAKATCLVTCRVIQDSGAVAVLEELVRRGAEIGTHLHPWETSPFMASGLDVKYHTYPHELPLDVFEAKLANLTEAIAKRFGPPRSYRAGRWGLVASHLPILERLGYQTDSSVTPLLDWRPNLGVPKKEGGRGGPDYRRAPQQPYYPDYTDVTREGQAKIAELPVTVGFTRRIPRAIRRFYGTVPTLLQGVVRKTQILQPVWAIPAEHTADRLTRLVATELDGRPSVFNAALHSSELMVNGAPVTRTQEGVEKVFRQIDVLLSATAGSGRCVFETLTAAAERWVSSRRSLAREIRSGGSPRSGTIS